VKFLSILLISILITSSIVILNFDDAFAEPIFLAVRMLTPCCGFVSPNQQLDSVERITLTPGDSKSISLNIREVDGVLFSVSVDGGVNDDIDISIRDSTYGIKDCCSGRISDFYSNRVVLEFTEDRAATRTLIFNFDNSFSNDASKNIVFTYTIEKGDIPQDRSPATDFVNDPNKLDWAIVFVTSRNECSTRNQQALEFYGTLTIDYLDKFRIDHELHGGICIPKEQMIIAVDMLTKNGDLTIVIPDYLMSIKDRHTTDSLGHYSNWSVKTIVSQAETLKIEDGDTGWVLSHELAHFALDWKGYNQKIMGEAVHEVQKQFNSCKSYDTTLTNCSILWETFQTPSKKWIAVMEPDAVIQVAESMKQKTASSNTSNQKTTIPKDPSNFNKLLEDYEWVKKDMKNRISSRLLEYSFLQFENPQANEKLVYVIQELSKMNFDNSDRYVENFKEYWNDGYYSDAETLLRGEINYWTQQQAPALTALDAKIAEARKLAKESKPSSIYISTNKKTYQEGDNVEIAIKVNNHQKYLDTFLTSIDPNNVAYRNKIQLNDRGEYSISAIVSTSKNIPIGKYSLTVEHGSLTQTTYYSYTDPPETTQPSPVIQQEPIQKIESTQKQKTVCGPGTTVTWTDNDGVVHKAGTVLKDGVCVVEDFRSNESVKKDADLMEQFKVIIDLVNMIKDAIYTQLSSMFHI